MTIFLSGGGTLGSVTPLLAVASELKKQNPQIQPQWIGTRRGVEEEIIAKAGIPYHPIWSAKVRRYWSIQNLIAPLFFLSGFFQSIALILKFRPKVILSAGGYVSVPLVWAGWLVRVPSLIHQQDLRPGFANRLMQPFAKRVTVAFQESLKFFPKHKTIWTGNPVRPEVFKGDREKAFSLFHLEKNVPTLLIIGGGTGAMFLNKLVVEALPELTKFCQVIHLIGKNKLSTLNSQLSTNSRYHPYEFLTDEMPHAFAIADLVLSRAGLGTLSELAALGKPAIIIPMAGTHQEENAKFFARHGAVINFSERELTSERFIQEVKKLFQDNKYCEQLKAQMKKLVKPDAAREITAIIMQSL